MTQKTMIIKAVEQDGKFILADDKGNPVQESFGYDSKIAAYAAAADLWPANSVWHGCMTHTGYRIDIS